jgi:hypothetical protein
MYRITTTTTNNNNTTTSSIWHRKALRSQNPVLSKIKNYNLCTWVLQEHVCLKSCGHCEWSISFKTTCKTLKPKRILVIIACVGVFKTSLGAKIYCTKFTAIQIEPLQISLYTSTHLSNNNYTMFKCITTETTQWTAGGIISYYVAIMLSALL